MKETLTEEQNQIKQNASSAGSGIDCALDPAFIEAMAIKQLQQEKLQEEVQKMKDKLRKRRSFFRRLFPWVIIIRIGRL